MKPKIKAEELVLNFLRIDNNTPEWFNTHIAKQCALIAVDEIIKNQMSMKVFYDNIEVVYNVRFWQDVKTEIQNL